MESTCFRVRTTARSATGSCSRSPAPAPNPNTRRPPSTSRGAGGAHIYTLPNDRLQLKHVVDSGPFHHRGMIEGDQIDRMVWYVENDDGTTDKMTAPAGESDVRRTAAGRSGPGSIFSMGSATASR